MHPSAAPEEERSRGTQNKGEGESGDTSTMNIIENHIGSDSIKEGPNMMESVVHRDWMIVNQKKRNPRVVKSTPKRGVDSAKYPKSMGSRNIWAVKGKVQTNTTGTRRR